MKPIRLTVGDVFTIPIDEVHFGIGQIVATYGTDAYFLAIFDAVGSDAALPDLDLALSQPLVFLALTFDAKIALGHWPIFGRRTVRQDLPFPAFKEMVGGPGRFDIVDYSGCLRRPAQAEEEESVPNRRIVSPIRFEKALRARHGFGPWTAAYDCLIPDEFYTTERLFQK